jgi:hypothetical protein
VGPQPGIERQAFSQKPIALLQNVSRYSTYGTQVLKKGFPPPFLPSVSRIRHTGFTNSELMEMNNSDQLLSINRYD